MLKAMAFSLKLGKVALVYPVVKQVAAVGVEHLSQLVVSIAALACKQPRQRLLALIERPGFPVEPGGVAVAEKPRAAMPGQGRGGGGGGATPALAASISSTSFCASSASWSSSRSFS